MANAGKPTPRTRHIDIKYHSLCEWVGRDLILLERISTSQNMADLFTKALPRILFYRHVYFILGHVPPPHSHHFATHFWLLEDENPNVIAAAKIDDTMPFSHHVYYMNARSHHVFFWSTISFYASIFFL